MFSCITGRRYHSRHDVPAVAVLATHYLRSSIALNAAKNRQYCYLLVLNYEIHNPPTSQIAGSFHFQDIYQHNKMLLKHISLIRTDITGKNSNIFLTQ